MTAQKGSLVLIKVGDGATPVENFSTVGGLRLTRLLLNSQAVESAHRESGAWRLLLVGGGLRQVTLSGSGAFTNAASEETVRGYAFAGTVNNYKFFFANGGNVAGAFLITAYERSGDYDEEELYSLTLESAGAVTYSAS